MKNLRNPRNQISISLPTDDSGYLGRECPSSDCKGYFKIINGTGLSGVTDCHCPYCGHTADQSEFSTPDQIEYAKSVAIREITNAFAKDLKRLEFDIKPSGAFGIGLSMKVKHGEPHPIHWYREKILETHIECSNCTLKYAVFGVFAFCPDCRQHNSLQILNKNLELAVKMIDMAVTAEVEITERLIENALQDCVSAFDGFGREICRIHANKSSDLSKVERISFQNLDGAKRNFAMLFGFDFTSGLVVEEWKAAIRGFQRRHLLSHKMGVVDDEYIRKSGDARAIVGRKVSIEVDEVRELVQVIGKLAVGISDNLQKIEKKP